MIDYKKIQKDLLLEEKIEPSALSYIQTLFDILNNINISTIKDKQYIEIAKQHLYKLKSLIKKSNEKIQELEEDYQQRIKKGYSEKKRKMIGQGNEPNTKPYSERPSYKRSKSAPPGFGAMGE